MKSLEPETYHLLQHLVDYFSGEQSEEYIAFKEALKSEEEKAFEKSQETVYQELIEYTVPFEPSHNLVELYYDYPTQKLTLAKSSDHQVFNAYYFSSLEEAQRAIAEVGEERILTYIYPNRNNGMIEFL